MEVEITLSEEEKAFVDRQVAEDRYADISGYLTSLIADDARRQLVAVVQAGIESPHRELTEAVWAEIRVKGLAPLNAGK